jgi:hypothetical protein
MNEEPRYRDDYSDRQIEAARRVLVDLGQVLAAYTDCLVVIGGWVPDLLLPDADEPHAGSIDVDLAVNTARLADGRYADMLKLLLDTRRYRPGAKPFQFIAEVDLDDGDVPVHVEVEFLAPREVKLKKNRPKLLTGFRILQADACGTAFREPVEVSIEGLTICGTRNRVRLPVASPSDFLVMKAHALAKRDKPKDAYDLCYVLDERSDEIARNWRTRSLEPEVGAAIAFLREKFSSPESYGPRQLVAFHDDQDPAERARKARRAYELVESFLAMIGASEDVSPSSL